MAYLKRDDIMKVQDLTFEEVDVPEWGGQVRVKMMTGSERDAYEASLYELKGQEVKMNRDDVRAKLLVKCLVDENNNRLFTDAEIKMLGKKSSKVLDKLFTVAQRLNAMTDEDVKKLEKNSVSEGEGTSTSPLPKS